MSFFTGNKAKMRQVPTMAPWQLEGLQNAFNNPITNDPNYQAGSNYLQRILSGDPSAFADFEAPFMQQFNQQVVPGIAQRFAGMGTGSSGLNSSGLNNSLSQAGQQLSTNLAGLRSGLQMQAAGQALPYAQQPYSNTFAGSQISPYAYVEEPGSTGFLGGLAGAAGQGLGLAGGGGLMNLLMSVIGGGMF